MLRFQWNALRTGDHVLVHDDLESGLELNEGVVKLVETRAGYANDVGIRVNSIAKVLRPRRHSVHLIPLDQRISCWRCDTTAHGTPLERHAVAA